MILVWAGIGAVVGVGGALLVQTGPDWAAALVHYAVPYVVLLSLIGATAARPRSAASRAIACFVPFVVGYYALVGLRFGAIPVAYAAAWLGVAVLVCPIAAAVLCSRAGRPGAATALVAASAGAVALADGALGNVVRVALRRLDPSVLQPAVLVAAAVEVLVAVGVLLLLASDRRTRLQALGLIVPLGIVTTWAGWAVHFGIGPYR